ncbi:hypothetical protein SERLADRAFT_448412 [Serpula lacrymans var. lacrymans S7.9]|uniref:EXS domain-containing protein n=1 Tax=Serpula lacrymans var. lacrymans (strain S7.9) TaxID=578457 RepID=F8NSW4_SERL9|nr:uncharacterized protein SERLADRAFT_448412 [Serpula lacrymans var. lacrymans S7.9]EGO25437.1 hypothetical protein SERLADRAFT_448412 [Serpula lacrymans var. lacrymans S7.9]
MDMSNEIPLAASFPLPFRVLFLAGMGILGWATNLHGLHLLGIDAPAVLELQEPQDHIPLRLPSSRLSGFRRILDAALTYTPVYRVFTAYSLWCFVAWLYFRYSSQSDPALVDLFKYIPAVCALGALTLLLCPYDVFQKHERDAFIFSIRRCISPPSGHPIYFSDVVFADVFTSFAKVLGDVWLSVLMLLPGGSLLSLPSQDGWSRWILPVLMSLPYLARFRQCLVEHASSTNDSRRPLYNAIKYASSFPVIFLSAAQRIVISDLVEEKGEGVTREAWHGEHQLFRLWLLAAAVNSVYSFWWDVTNDWGLDLLKPRPAESRGRPPRALVLPSLHSKSTSMTGSPVHSPSSSADLSSQSRSGIYTPIPPQQSSYPFGLRPVLLYPLPVYPLIIFLNLVLRLTWSIKLSSHLHSETEGSALIFWLEMAELVRRWMWVFVRVEWEAVKKSREGRRSGIKIAAYFMQVPDEV